MVDQVKKILPELIFIAEVTTMSKAHPEGQNGVPHRSQVFFEYAFEFQEVVIELKTIVDRTEWISPLSNRLTIPSVNTLNKTFMKVVEVVPMSNGYGNCLLHSHSLFKFVRDVNSEFVVSFIVIMTECTPPSISFTLVPN